MLTWRTFHQGAGCDVLKDEIKLGKAVDELRLQMKENESICIVGQNSTGVASAGAEGHVLKAPSGIISYEPDELMVSLFAGSTISDINAALHMANQRIVVPDWGTIGGAVATRRNGLRVPQHQTLPHNVLRCTVIAADGSLYQCGGQVVKNVSGFDLVKLLVGSWGLLGLIVEVTMRTEPIPQMSQWVQSFEPSATRQANNLYRPAVVTQIGDSTYVLLEGKELDVQGQLSSLQGFTLCEAPHVDPLTQINDLGCASQEFPLSIEQRIRKQFDPSNKLNRHIARQRTLLT